MLLLDGPALNLLSSASHFTENTGFELWVELGGSHRVIERCLLELRRLASSAVATLERRENADSDWHRISNLAHWLHAENREVTVLKAALPLKVMEEFVRRARYEAGSQNISIASFAQTGVGIAHLCVSDEPNLNALADYVTRVRQIATDLSGTLVVEHAAVELKRKIDVWGAHSDDLGAMRKLKSVVGSAMAYCRLAVLSMGFRIQDHGLIDPSKQTQMPLSSREAGESAIVAKPSGYGAGEAPRWADYSRCVHCGLCLNACPTYRELGLEADSPRGRIYQMIQVEKGRLPIGDSFVKHIDLCLDCRACETACPSGVEYGKLVEMARAQIEQHYHRPPLTTLMRKLFYYELLPHPARLRFVGALLRFYQQSGLEKLVLGSGILKLLPGRLDQLAQLSPRMESPFFFDRLGKTFPAEGERKYRVALFAGCIANLSFARLNDATIRVLTKNGCEVIVPREQGCCGALHVHAGIRNLARDLAKRNIEIFRPGDFDAFITNAAGCGSVLKEYPLLFEEEEREFYEPAKAFVAKVRDVTEFLAGIDFNRELGTLNARATYQDPCHLGHGQNVRSAPRKLLAAIPGLELVELKEAEVCCGSAGVYNVLQNEMADRLLENKMRRIDETKADLVLTANPGCLLQLRAGEKRTAHPRRVLHVVELLDEAYLSAASHNKLRAAGKRLVADFI